MKYFLEAFKEDFPANRSSNEEEKRQQVMVGYLIGKILVDRRVLNSGQLAEALKRHWELREKGCGKSLGALSVEMGYTTAKEYLNALSQYFGLPVISLLKFIPYPAMQGLLLDRYVQKNKLLILADYGTEVMLTPSEPAPSILEELQKTCLPRDKVNSHLADPFEMERCFHPPYGSQNP
jgi:hypothetical protein